MSRYYSMQLVLLLLTQTRANAFPSDPSPHPTQIVVGGAINGQVVMWNISKALTSIDQKKRKQSVRHIGKPGLGVGGEGEEVLAVLPPVKPQAVSHIDLSHRRLVADLVWLPTTTQVNSTAASISLVCTKKFRVSLVGCHTEQIIFNTNRQQLYTAGP